MAGGGFLDRYTARFDLAPVPAYDYAEIVRIAAALLSRAATRDRERKAYDVVLVNEYQDTDPAQEALLHALAGDGRELIAVGDPDQSIYAFRGADVHAMGRFPDLFRTPDDRPASIVALRTCRRSGPVLLAASRRVAARLPAAAGLSAAGDPPRPGPRLASPAASPPGRGHRDLLPLATGTPGPSGSWWPPVSARKPPSSPTPCAVRTWWTASPGRRWPSWCARPRGRFRCCAVPWRQEAFPRSWRVMSCRWLRSRVPGRCSRCCAAPCSQERSTRTPLPSC